MTEPALSAILVSEEGGDALAPILSRLAAQDVAARIEVVVAASRPEALAPMPRFTAAFAAFRVVAADTATSATARATAIAHARAACVALVEDHSFPVGADWARRLLEGFEAGHAGVGPVVRNANPDTRTSRANLAVEYADWMHAPAPRESETLPGHNSAYRRDLLLAYGTALGPMLEAEWVLQADLRRRGHTLLLDPRIAVAHLNYARPGRSVRLQFLAGRMFAASRSASWSRARRLGWALACPAIPLVRLARILRLTLGHAEGRRAMAGAVPMTALLLAASGLGEGLGYALGDGGGRRALAEMEYRRWRNLLPDEVPLAR